jgi:hypothetical protein
MGGKRTLGTGSNTGVPLAPNPPGSQLSSVSFLIPIQGNGFSEGLQRSNVRLVEWARKLPQRPAIFIMLIACC